MGTPFESITDPAITQEHADQLLAAGGGNSAVRRLVHVLRSRTMVLILGERAGLFNASEALREVSELRTFTEHELGQLRKAASGVLVTFSGHDPDSIRLMQSMLTEAARRLVLADREARRLWDSPEIVDRARAINAEAIDNPGRASDETRKRWKDWRNRNLPERRAA